MTGEIMRDDAGMKEEDGQLYTIEGIAAALIMLMTAFLVVNATSVYTAGDTHINDMQLEALGNDALKLMGTPANTTMNAIDTSPLRTMIENNDKTAFKTVFLNLTNNRTGSPADYVGKIGTTMDYIQYDASVTCRNATNNNVETFPFSHSREMTGGEHAVRATKWVVVDKIMNDPDLCSFNNGKDRAVLVEVLIWRD